MTKSSSSLSLKQQSSCTECKKPTADLKKCSRCMSIAYCSRECQLKDWPNHKKMCSSGKPKAEKRSAAEKAISDESGCPRKTKNISGVSMQARMEDCATKESRVKDVSSAKEVENDPLVKTKIKDCSSERSNSEGSSSEKPMSKDNIEKDSEIGSSIKAESPSQPHLQETQSNDGNAAVTDNSVCPKSVELCIHCQLEKTNMKKCTKCKSAAYCSQECQRADWKRHKLECQTQELPSAAPLMNRCNSCGVVGKEMKKCSQCKAVSYCSIECQRKDWKSHKTTCRQP